LVKVKLIVVVPVGTILKVVVCPPKAFETVGGANTFKLAVLEALPVPPSFELMAPVVLLTVPPVVPLTLTEIVQGVPTASVAPDTDSAVAPAVKLEVFMPPPQLFDVTFGWEERG
jgi:hypothetical protein